MFSVDPEVPFSDSLTVSFSRSLTVAVNYVIACPPSGARLGDFIVKIIGSHSRKETAHPRVVLDKMQRAVKRMCEGG